MSLLSSSIGAALVALNSASGHSLAYRNAISGAWTTLSNSFLEHSGPEVITFDENRHAVMVPESATLKVPVAQTKLIAGTPTKPGAQVRHTLGANVTVWAVIAATHTDTQSTYLLGRAVAQSTSPDRNATP